MNLFESEWQAKHQSLDRTVDAIRARFGDDSIRRAGRPPASS